MISAFFELVKQLIEGPATNPFPAKFAPSSVKKFLEKGKINPPVPVPPKFRGKLEYNRDTCVGCGLCAKVCPANAIEMVGEPPNRKIRVFISRCTFCSQCVDICPTKSLSMSGEFLLADTDKNSKNLIVD